jgi:putative hydrolase of the HAD superfamily
VWRPAAVASLSRTLGITQRLPRAATSKDNLRVPSAVRTIIFDFFGVVAAFDEDILYRRIASHCPDPHSVRKALHGLPSTRSLIEGRTTLADLHARLVARHGLSVSIQSFEELWVQPYSWPMAEFAPLLEELSGQFRLVLLSNVDRDYFEAIRTHHPELQHFSVELVSYKMGFSKPSEQAFRAAINAAEALAQECYFVDDKSENIAAASKLGIQGHFFTSTQACRAALTENGVLAWRSDA